MIISLLIILFVKFSFSLEWTNTSIKDRTCLKGVSFCSTKIGFIAAELGLIYKTTDGGSSWEKVLDLDFPYYFYSIRALNCSYIIVAGFNDNAGGIISISKDGGDSWSKPKQLSDQWFMFGMRFVGEKGIIQAFQSAVITKDGGQTFKTVPVGEGWWGDDFTFFDNGEVIMTGIDSFCTSKDFGESWSCITEGDDPHGANSFLDKSFGAVISGWMTSEEENESGGVYITTDMGRSFSKVLSTPYNLRNVKIINKDLVIATGGCFAGEGGIYISTNGGKDWKLDLNTGVEVIGVEVIELKDKYLIMCVGSNPGENLFFKTEYKK